MRFEVQSADLSGAWHDELLSATGSREHDALQEWAPKSVLDEVRARGLEQCRGALSDTVRGAASLWFELRQNMSVPDNRGKL